MIKNLLNISGGDVEEKLKSSISEVNKELSGLDIEQMCRVYSGHLYKSLRDKHVMCRLVDTSDLNCSYAHQFILVNDIKRYFVADLTFRQFGEDDYLKSLSKDGYEEFDSLKWAYYFSKFDCYGVSSMDEVFDGSYTNKKSMSK